MQKIFYSQENNTKYMKILDLTTPLAEQKIKSAYRNFVKSNHPDLFKLEENKKLATVKFKFATDAYEYLLKHWKIINSPNTASYTDTFYKFTSHKENFEQSLKRWRETKINTDVVDKLIASIRNCDKKIYIKFHQYYTNLQYQNMSSNQNFLF